jgi:uncharacterized phage protein (TIGR02218 family)
MSFDSNMQATEQLAIPELYVFTGGAWQWRFTSYATDIEFASETYKTISLKRSGFNSTRQLGASRVSLYIPVLSPMTSYLSNAPTPSIKVQIYRALIDAPTEYALLFDGRIKKVVCQERVLQADCALDDELSARMPPLVYQSYCNWGVFECGCGLLESNWEVSAVVSVSGSSLISSTFSTFASGYFSQGKIKFQGDWRFITNHIGAQVDLQLPFGSDLVSGGVVSAYPGCDGAPATCKAKFNNFDTRHVSMPYIPSHNPVLWGFR